MLRALGLVFALASTGYLWASNLSTFETFGASTIEKLVLNTRAIDQRVSDCVGISSSKFGFAKNLDISALENTCHRVADYSSTVFGNASAAYALMSLQALTIEDIDAAVANLEKSYQADSSSSWMAQRRLATWSLFPETFDVCSRPDYKADAGTIESTPTRRARVFVDPCATEKGG